MNDNSVRVQVLALMAGTIREVIGWHFQSDRQSNMRAVYLDGVDRPQGEAWDDLSLEIVRRALPSSGDSGRAVEVFLYLHDDLAASIYNYADLKQLVADAKRHAWGNKIYVAWNRSPHTEFANIYTDTKPALLEIWLGSLIDEDVAGVLEVKRGRDTLSDALETVKLLRRHTSEYTKRKSLLDSLTAGQGWGLSHRKSAKPLGDLLGGFVKSQRLPGASHNHIIFLDRKLTLPLRKELLDDRPPGNYVVATTQEAYSKDLEVACAAQSPPLQMIQFSGHFEAIYSLLQMNRFWNHRR
jgi:hypothetical protein